MRVIWRLRSGLVGVVLATSLSCLTCVAQETGAGPAANEFAIGGVVVSTLGGALLPLTRVTITNAKNPKDTQSQVTGEDGRFVFHVKAGKYALQGAKRGFMTGNYEQHAQFSTAIVTGAGLETTDIVLKLAPLAVLHGKVLDESGEPVRMARVTLWREDHSVGVSRIASFRTSLADDQGTYEFSPLNAGTYFVSVVATPWYAVHPPSAVGEDKSVLPVAVDRGLDVVYPTTYYAGATESDEATPIPIQGGDRVEIDLHLVAAPALHVIFRDEQQGNGAFGMPTLRKRAFDGFEQQRGAQDIQQIAPGVFEMTTAPGSYQVYLRGAAGNERVSDVDITQDRQELDATSGEAAGRIKALVRVQGREDLPRELYVVLQDARKKRRGGARVDSHGEADFGSVVAGTYEVIAGTLGGSVYAAARVQSEGQESAGKMLKVTAGQTLSVSVTLVEARGRGDGFVKAGGKGVAGAMVVLVPKHPESNGDYFRRDQSDLDGSFSLQQVAPGTYTVVAIADGWDLDWSKAGVIAKYAAHGQMVTVPDSKDPVELRLPVEVQQK
jgi:hypothetical protein